MDRADSPSYVVRIRGEIIVNASALLISTFLVLAGLSAGPLLRLAFDSGVRASDWQNATSEPSGLAPTPKSHPEAVVQVYAARTFSWRGAFARFGRGLAHNGHLGEARNDELSGFVEFLVADRCHMLDHGLQTRPMRMLSGASRIPRNAG